MHISRRTVCRADKRLRRICRIYSSIFRNFTAPLRYIGAALSFFRLVVVFICADIVFRLIIRL